ncbi:MAG TPA: hypothetical protein VER33_03100 [Polyangiaceae bacterium]|nr:hypothetical protein [Polyangiaceae bacterium]
MHGEQIKLVGWVLAVTLIAGFADARAFIHASRVWGDGKVVWRELAKSALGFAVGIVSYWVALKPMQQAGIVTPEVQTVIWFGITLVGVALASGKFFKWPLREQLVAVAVLVGLSWLLYRTSE